MVKSKRARIQDVAELAGVSNMTVSRVLSKDVKVSDAKKTAVMAAVKKLNYRPNVAARRLASNKSFFIGLLYYDLDTSYVSKFLLRALKSCRAFGHHLVPDEIDDDKAKSIRAVRELIDITQIDGLILLPPVCEMQEILDVLVEAKIPFVRIAPDTQLDISPYIAIDEYLAGFSMTNHLIDLGHQRIGHIIGNPNQGASRLRYQGYLDALRSKQINVPPDYIEQGFFTYESGLNAANKLLSLAEPPTAIFASNDEMAAAVVSVANAKNIAVPNALSVAGFDDGHLAITLSPHLTTVRQPILEMADLAVEMLISGKVVSNKKAHLTDCRNILDFEIIERKSTTAAPQSLLLSLIPSDN
ncbi:MAG: LacI family DNA-binding transcriptional regulator [Thalassotalea sp.]